ncbi:MAG TPA: SDR family NAD(P)-dependent oxidoreductase [Phycisphaerales bacterium]|nr:SDR family NAD(P)-dependent oxidoreductase [Phycisphaerales bacterium]
MPHDLHGLPIAITGAGTGIGRATAIACAAAGMRVALAGRREEALRAVEAAITSAGGRAIVVPTDVADAGQCERLVDQTVLAFGSIYAVFANAGYGLRGPVHELADGAIRDIFETNFWGTLNTVRPALRHMLAARRGHLVICSSCLSKLGTPYTAPYSATKAAQDHFGRAMRIELRPLGVRVSTVHPVGTRTGFSDAAAERSGGARRSLRAPGAFTQAPERVAGAVVRCLRRPRGEVWTSTPARLALGAAVAFPGIADRLLRRAYGRA